VNKVLNYEQNGLKFDGFFVDLACADGVTINNTYFLEKHLQWAGILFEPNPYFSDSIHENRTAPLVAKCVSDTEGQTIRFRIDNGMLGGIVSDELDNSEAVRGEELRAAEIVDIKTTTLEIELDKANAPALIDFLSLDVEGAEWLVLKNFDFSKYKFRFAAIERPTPELDLLLHHNGYRQVKHSQYDVFYVHADFLADLNWAPKFEFAFTPKKEW